MKHFILAIAACCTAQLALSGETPTSGLVPAIALGMMMYNEVVIPGALVCPDLRTVDFVSHRYLDYFGYKVTNRLLDEKTKRRWELTGEHSPEKPQPEDYGCTLVPTGTTMQLNKVDFPPTVKVKLHGKWVSGVIGLQMCKELNPSSPEGQ